MKAPISIRAAKELSMYGSVAAGMAAAMVFAFRPPQEAVERDAPEPVVVRSEADARLLRTALRLPAGKTALIEFMKTLK